MAESINTPKKKFHFISSSWSDPGLNLSLEEYLLEHPAAVSGNLPVLLVYENSEALVIGKNQNPWMEVSREALARGRPRLYRRISGGGSVYHGPGNLNFSFIVPQADFSKEGDLDLVRRAALRLGLDLERTSRGDLLCRGRKVSGNALCYRRGRVLHHGTLLVDADLSALRSSLRGGEAASDIETRAVASVPMSVANLAEFLPGLTVSRVAEALRREAESAYGECEAGDFLLDPALRAALEAGRLRHESREWVFGGTPAFSCRIGDTRLFVENGRIIRGEETGGGLFDTALIDSIFDLNMYEEERHGHAEHVSQARQDS